MDKQTAMRLLELEGRESPKEIKSQFRKMLHRYHPDATGMDATFAGEMVRNLIEAYEVLSKPSKTDGSRIRKEWNAPVNVMAAEERSIYASFEMLDGEAFDLEITKGRYIWNPAEEDFEHFTKSIVEVAETILNHHGKPGTDPAMVRLFPLLMDEYIYPFYAAEKLAEKIEEKEEGYLYSFTGYIKEYGKEKAFMEGNRAKVRIRETAIYLQFDHIPQYCKLTFDRNCLYPVVLSVLRSGKVAAMCEVIAVPDSKKGRRMSDSIKVAFTIMMREKIVDQPRSNKEKMDRLFRERDL
ncbi:MAG: J domain-containing protein [Lachnospiraceae bacterium]|jgi:hypothetical protein|nr:J domain-containing protein [Lachnospiraceae bacterium]